MGNVEKILLNKTSCKSVWFMRQAGRYLPEFRKIRIKNPNFIKLCLNSELSSEITLQPIKRFNLDAAIIFSDILMIPYALGQNITFLKDEGPKLEKFDNKSFSSCSNKEFVNRLKPVYDAISITRKKLDKKKSLISFVGAPWTLLVYMFELKKNKEEINSKKIVSEENNLRTIIEKLVHYICLHIKNQINAGADVVQIFDSWAGLIPTKYIKDYCLMPNAKIVEFCRKENIHNICFPKGLKEKYEDFNKIVKPDGINLDYEIDPVWAKEKLKNVVIQGGLSPFALLKPDDDMYELATNYFETFKDIPYIFNLGHGLLPETDPDKVKRLVNFYRRF